MLWRIQSIHTRNQAIIFGKSLENRSLKRSPNNHDSQYWVCTFDAKRLVETSNFDRALRSLKTDIKFSKEVCLPKN